MCSSDHCPGTSGLHDLRLITECGHRACASCLSSRLGDEKCVNVSCSVLISALDQINVKDLGKPTKAANRHGYGNKLKAIVSLIQNMPHEDQGVVFVPNQETVSILVNLLEVFDIPVLALGPKRSAAKLVQEFKNNRDPKSRKKILVLNLGSESAAGLNLTNANHMIFVSPLLTKSQYEFDSAMAQAIARIRRYGQTKPVHIYHFAALHTIDADVLEHRHRRKDGITTPGCGVEMPSADVKKEWTRLVKVRDRKEDGRGKGMGKGDEWKGMALVPRSWLEDDKKRRMLGIGEDLRSFTSLIRYEEGFQDDDG